MEELPRRIVDRIVGRRYFYNNEIVIWDGQRLKCKHNKRKRRCELCGGKALCEHGKRKSHCVICGGSQICQHNRQRNTCKECKGSSICIHNRQKHTCKDCNGSQICIHNRIRNVCKDCNGSSICIHNKHRSVCEYCNESGFILNRLRARMYETIFNQKGEKRESTTSLLGADIKVVREYIENQFTDGMTWDNHGIWHIDHRRPCSSFDLRNEDEQKKCFHYTNLQPLLAAENISKSDSFDEEDFDSEWNGNEWIKKP